MKETILEISPIIDGKQALTMRRLAMLFDETVKILRKAHHRVQMIDDAKEAIERDRVKLWIAAGILLNTYHPISRRSLREIYAELKESISGLYFSNMYRAMCIAKRFGNDLDEFDKWYTGETVYDTLTGVYNTLFVGRKVGYSKKESGKYHNPLDAAMQNIDDMTLYANRDGQSYMEYAEKLRILRQYIDARMPIVDDFNDDTFFKFSPCCSCGKHPGADEGYDLFEAAHGDIKILVPMCNPCLRAREDVNWARVAHMYFLYSLYAQNEMEKFTPGEAYGSAGIYTVEM